MTPEEKRLIVLALRWARGEATERIAQRDWEAMGALLGRLCCPDCGGRGTVGRLPCPKCGGRGA